MEMGYCDISLPPSVKIFANSSPWMVQKDIVAKMIKRPDIMKTPPMIMKKTVKIFKNVHCTAIWVIAQMKMIMP